MASREADLESIRRGQVANIVKSDISQRLDQQRRKILNTLIKSYRDPENTLTTEKIWGSIGALDALDLLESELNNDIALGRKKSDG